MIVKILNISIQGKLCASEKIRVFIDEEELKLAWIDSGAKLRQALLTPSRTIKPSQSLDISYQVPRRYLWPTKDVSFTITGKDLSEIYPEKSKKEWRSESKGKTSVKINFETKIALNDAILSDDGDLSLGEILEVCPRLRILVIGKSGVGKSSLINEIFGVTTVNINHEERGEADIEKEHTSDQNDKFIIHDSLGFEAGEIKNLDTAVNFIRDRNEKPHIKDKLHAIWLCTEIPTGGSRVVEKATEEILKAKSRGWFGDVPIIGVFTKYDQLVSKCIFHKASDPEKEALRLVEAECFVPLREACTEFGNTVLPLVKVSTSEKYRSTCNELVDVTQKLVEKYLGENVGLVMAMAQRSSLDATIWASVELGKRKYWKTLISPILKGKSFQHCLDVVHRDIVKVWNFQDKYKYLESDQFRQKLYELIDPIMKRSKGSLSEIIANDNTSAQPAIDNAAALVNMAIPQSGTPAAAVATVFVGAASVFSWLLDVRLDMSIRVQGLLTYNAQLTLIMRIIFWIQQVQTLRGQTVSRRIIKHALKTYLKSGTSAAIKQIIETHVKETPLTDPDSMISKVENLITSSDYRDDFKPGTDEELKAMFSGGEDESW